jgi:hypothetical protein
MNDMVPFLRIFTLLVSISLCSPLSAQPFLGLWEVTKVSIGDQSMTPAGKWSHFKSDGSYTSGNGWLQNSIGTWSYEPANGTLTTAETNGIKDPFGPFLISVNGDKMTWKRTEEGALVTVSWKRTDQLPIGPAEKVVGLWGLVDTQTKAENPASKIDPDSNYHIFISWGRTFWKRSTPGGRKTGYWFIHPHRPELTLIWHGEDLKESKWWVRFEDEQMIWEGNSADNLGQLRIFNRLPDFPN